MAGTRLVLAISFAIPFFIIILSALWFGLLLPRNPSEYHSIRLPPPDDTTTTSTSTPDSLLYTILFRQQGRYLLQKQHDLVWNQPSSIQVLGFRPFRIQVLLLASSNTNWQEEEDDIIQTSIRRLLNTNSTNIQLDIQTTIPKTTDEADRMQQFCTTSTNTGSEYLDNTFRIDTKDIDLYICYNYNLNTNDSADGTMTKITIDPTNRVTIVHLQHLSLVQTSTKVSLPFPRLGLSKPSNQYSYNHYYHYPYNKQTQKIIENQIHITIVVDDDQLLLYDDYTINQWWYDEIQQQRSTIQLPKYCSQYLSSIIPTVSIVPWDDSFRSIISTASNTTTIATESNTTDNEPKDGRKIPFQYVSQFVQQQRNKLVHLLQKEYGIYTNDEKTSIQQWILYMPTSASMIKYTIFDTTTDQTSDSILVRTNTQKQPPQPFLYIDSRFRIVHPPRYDVLLDHQQQQQDRTMDMVITISNLVEQFITSECYNIPITDNDDTIEWNISPLSSSSYKELHNIRILSKWYNGLEYQQRIQKAYTEAMALAEQVHTFLLQLSYKVPIDTNVAEEWMQAYTTLQAIRAEFVQENVTNNTNNGYDEEYIVLLDATLNSIHDTIHIFQKLRNSSVLAEPLTMSIEQYFAILSPLVVPLLLPILLTLLREWKRYKKLVHVPNSNKS